MNGPAGLRRARRAGASASDTAAVDASALYATVQSAVLNKTHNITPRDALTYIPVHAQFLDEFLHILVEHVKHGAKPGFGANIEASWLGCVPLASPPCRHPHPNGQGRLAVSQMSSNACHARCYLCTVTITVITININITITIIIADRILAITSIIVTISIAAF